MCVGNSHNIYQTLNRRSVRLRINLNNRYYGIASPSTYVTDGILSLMAAKIIDGKAVREYNLDKFTNDY